MKERIFSIITVCRNNIEGLKATYQSIRAQSFEDYEWIVIDGASTDDTLNFLEQLPSAENYWVSETDRGLYDAMNKGITKATGRYLLFLNGGDELAGPRVLEKVAQAVIVNGYPQFVYGDAYEYDSDQKLILKKAYSYKRLWYGMFTHHQAMFFARDAISHIYATDMEYASDYGFVATHLMMCKAIMQLQIPICKFRSGGISQTGSTAIADREQWRIRREVLGYSVLKCLMIHALHKLIHLTKQNLPIIYKRARFTNVRN